MAIWEILLFLVAAIGHVTLWITCINRIHSVFFPRWVIEAFSGFCWSMLLVIAWLFVSFFRLDTVALEKPDSWIPLGYIGVCVLLAIYGIIVRIDELIRKPHCAAAMLLDEVNKVDISARLGKPPVGNRISAWMAKLPGNQVFRLTIHHKMLQIPRLAPGLDGLTIAHLSDLHMSGRITKPYFEEIVSLTNQVRPDLIVITGDLFDSTDCLGWIGDTLEKLESRGGTYFVLGNHDLRIDHAAARQSLTDAGLIDLGGRHRQITINNHHLLLAGNELPWFVPAADVTDCPVHAGGERILRLLLSHAPDQIDWAQANDFDLMLAGHTHGGQIRLPFVGPIVSPSRLGTKFAAGTFYQEPTVMHVSRGISSLTPLRWNCPPELTFLHLRSGIISGTEQEAALQMAQGVG